MQETFVDNDTGYRSEYLLNVATSSGLQRSASNVTSNSKGSSSSSSNSSGRAPISKPVRRSKSQLNNSNHRSGSSLARHWQSAQSPF